MLWIKVKCGEAVYINDKPFMLVEKQKAKVVVLFEGRKYIVSYDSCLDFPDFIFMPGRTNSGLRLGFEAPRDVRIRRAKLEVKFPAK